jgi:putative two-component system response regulator
MSSFRVFGDADGYSADILVVDDEAANVRLLQKILEGAGYRHIRATQSPREAVAMCLEQPADLVILDINMPYMDGFEVMARLEQQLASRETSVLVLTAQDSRELRIRALETGVRDFVTKPFDRSELLARVRNLLELQLAQRWMRNQNQLLEEMVRTRTSELHRTRLKVVHHLGRAAEYRDNETGLHIIRMSNTSALLSRQAGLSDYECDLVLNASPMHDIGKIGIPDHILLKPGKLSSGEWEVMKTHAQIGADILSGDESDLMTMARDIALSHHEKWDGSGYPHELKGEEIPLAGRIVALADVFDALTSERPYKSAWSVDSAVDLVRRESGKHFDPSLVECFMAALPEIIAIRKRFAEPGEVAAAEPAWR